MMLTAVCSLAYDAAMSTRMGAWFLQSFKTAPPVGANCDQCAWCLHVLCGDICRHWDEVVTMHTILYLYQVSLTCCCCWAAAAVALGVVLLAKPLKALEALRTEQTGSHCFQPTLG